jgi:polyketide cyclase/dehydrase/lipid transport protein
MIKKILLGIVVLIIVLIAVFLVMVMLQPSHYQIERSATINAPAPVVFAQVNDFHKWNAWSPWANLDPNMKTTYEGQASGVGAMYSWTGNSDVGEGRMTIIESRPGELIRIQLDFIKPFAASNATEFVFTPQGNQTNVKWRMAGNNNFIAKAFSVFVNVDKMVGGDFEKGLAKLKAVSESAPK